MDELAARVEQLRNTGVLKLQRTVEPTLVELESFDFREPIDEADIDSSYFGISREKDSTYVGDEDDVDVIIEYDETWDPKNDPTDFDLMFDRVEYIADAHDKTFVEEYKRSFKPNSKLTLQIFEQAMDRFEKLQEFDIWKTNKDPWICLKHGSNMSTCEICGSDKELGNNHLVTCFVCGIKVHSECYGISYVPLAEWRCHRCNSVPLTKVTCMMCPMQNGAIKFTSNNRPIHQLCASWHNGVYITENSCLQPIDATEIEKYYNPTPCLYCQSKEGFVVNCADTNCRKFMHVSCAMLRNCKMRVDVGFGKKGVSRFRLIYCHTHSQLNAAEEEIGIKRILEAKEHQSYGTFRILPPDSEYIAPAFIHPLLEQDEVDLLCYYWVIKKIRRMGAGLIPRVAVMHDRLQKSCRKLKEDNNEPAPSYNAVKKRVTLEADGNGGIIIVANFRDQQPDYEDDPLEYFVPPPKDNSAQAFLDYEGQSIQFDGVKLFFKSIPLVDKDVEILLCRRESDISRVTLDLVKKYVDPSLSFDIGTSYGFVEDFPTWNIIGIIYYAAVPIHIQIYTFLGGLWFLDHAKMFTYFNYRSPDAVNLRTMTKKALLRGYSTLSDVYRDFHLMMLPLKSKHIEKRRRKYAENFEEAACYLMAPRTNIQMLRLLMKDLDNEEHSYKTLLQYMLNVVKLGENAAQTIDTIEQEKLAKIFKFARTLMKVEKTEPLPDLEMLKHLYARRGIKNRREPLIFKPWTHYLPFSVGHRFYYLAEIAYLYENEKVSWVDCTLIEHKREEVFQMKLNSDQTAVIPIKALRKRKPPKVLSPIQAKRTKGSDGPRVNHVVSEEPVIEIVPESMIAQALHISTEATENHVNHEIQEVPATNSVERVLRPRSQETGKAVRRKLKARQRPQSESVEGNIIPTSDTLYHRRFRPISNPLVFSLLRVPKNPRHEDVVIVSKGMLGDNIAAYVIDLTKAKTHRDLNLAAAPHAYQEGYILIRYFGHFNAAEWVPINHVSRLDYIELCKYFTRHRGKYDHSTQQIQSLKEAYKFHSNKLLDSDTEME